MLEQLSQALVCVDVLQRFMHLRGLRQEYDLWQPEVERIVRGITQLPDLPLSDVGLEELEDADSNIGRALHLTMTIVEIVRMEIGLCDPYRESARYRHTLEQDLHGYAIVQEVLMHVREDVNTAIRAKLKRLSA